MPAKASQQCLCRMDVLRREKVAAEEKAVVAATERENSERVAAQQLHIAHEQMTSKHQVRRQA